MQEDDFAPGGIVPLVRALASVNVRRKELSALARELAGEEYSNAALSAGAGTAQPLWGLVYAREDALGFYVHPPTSEFSMILDRGRLASSPIDVLIPANRLVSVKLADRQAVRTPLSRLMRRVAGEPPRVLSAEWMAADTTRRLEFFVERGADELAEVLSRHFARYN